MINNQCTLLHGPACGTDEMQNVAQTQIKNFILNSHFILSNNNKKNPDND